MTAATLPTLERLPAPSSFGAWMLACRPATLTAGIVPVLAGTAVAVALDSLRIGPALAALAGAVLIQIGTNFANDVFDFEKGADTAERMGPVRAAQAGLLSPRQLRAGMIAAFGLATAAGLYLAYVGGWPVVAIGVASILSGIAYTGGPYPLGYHGLGDVFVMVFFGFVAVCGTVYVQLDAVPALAWWVSVPIGALATAVLVVNNVRDRETDVKVGKRTLAVRFGRGGALAEYVLLMAASYLTPVGLVAAGAVSAWALLPLATLPVAIGLTRGVLANTGPALNQYLAGTAKLLMLYGVLFAAGLALG